MKNFKLLGLSILMLSSMQINAQDQPELQVRPTGRILMDGGLFHSDNKSFVDGVAIPDVRVGVKATYGKYKAKVDIGYAYGKVSLKDIFVERQFSSHSLLRVGNFVHQFGLQSSTSSSMKITMEEPTSNEAFFNSRLIGAMFVYDKDAFFGTASVHVENEALKKKSDELGKMGYGAMSRLVYRPLRNTGALFQIGISGAYETPRYNSDEALNHTSFDLGANFPTRIAKVRAVNAVITDAKDLVKFTPEMIVGYGPVALEAQYFYLQVNRENQLNDYKASGAYGILRGLLKGGSYQHSHTDCGIATPAPGSLECVLGYNYTDMSDAKSNIRGGRLNDVSFTVNYYINKYMIWRFRYSYTRTTDRLNVENQKLNAFQTRFQIIF
ncbi:porin [Phocaeicola sp.]